jgi:DNA-directed RNA polymerase subunit beta
MEFVAERLRGEVARFDIVDKSGKTIVRRQAYQRQARATSSRRHQAHLGAGRLLLGRVLAKNIVDATPAKSSPTPTTS